MRCGVQKAMKPTMFFLFACLVATSLAAGCGADEEGEAGRPFTADPFEPTLDSLATRQVPSWFEDAKFGIFIHWGPYSVPGYADLMFADLGIPGPSYAEWYWFMLMRIRWPGTIRYHLGHFGTDIVYDDFIDLWRAEAFDADDLVGLIRSSGARYAVLVTKHHDGVALFESSTTERTTAAMGPRRDFVGE